VIGDLLNCANQGPKTGDRKLKTVSSR